MRLDPVLLSRLQWAWVIAWHILLPAFTVGLASYIAVLEGLYFITARHIWLRISGFWTRLFAVSFGMGVVSGIICGCRQRFGYSAAALATLGAAATGGRRNSSSRAAVARLTHSMNLKSLA